MSHVIAHSTEYPTTAFKYVHKPSLWQQNTLIYRWFVEKTIFGCTLLLISIPVTACTRTINITCHSTLNGVSETSVQVRAQAVAMATKHPDISLIVEEISVWMHTPPDFNPCDGLCTHNQCYMS